MKKFSAIIGSLFLTLFLHAQSLSSLKNMNVDNLSDAQVGQLVQQMQSQGISTGQIDQYAASKGASPEQAQKLKKRIVQYSGQEVKSGNRYQGTDNRSNLTEDATINGPDPEKWRRDSIEAAKPKVFGTEIFKNAAMNFEPNLRLATPQNYVLGPDDEVLIDIYGLSEVSHKLYVSPEGTIRIPLVGVINVSGLTIAEARRVIKNRMTATYKGLASGNTSVSINLGNIRSITVHVIGEVAHPGSYTIPSLATVFNALYQSGGPKENGSFRDIQVIRNNQVIRTIDLYDFLVQGKQHDLRLQDQDVIKVLPYRNRVTLTGEVKTPAIFEMKSGETLQDLITFAGGFTEKAYRQSITGYRNTLKEQSVVSIENGNFKTFKTEPGDSYTVGKLLNRFENRVQISGAVYRPGVYALKEGMKVKELLQLAEGLKEDAFVNSAVIFRKNNLGLSEVASFSPKEVLNGQNDIALQREDSIYIGSVLDMKEKDFVYISGEVLKPDKYPFGEGMSLKDIIVLANGFKNKANVGEIEVYRQITDIKTLNENINKAESFKIKMDSAMENTATFKLKREDRVVVRPIFGAENMKEVTIEGEVIAPGNYVLKSKRQRISDLLIQAGGTSAYAYPQGAFLTRKHKKDDVDQKAMYQIKKDAALKVNSKTSAIDSLQMEKLDAITSDIVDIRLEKIIKHPGSKYDLQLEEGDVLSIPKQLETVNISGQVLRSTAVRYQSGKSLGYYISSAGGFSAKALAGRTYVVYPNGSVDATSHFLGFRVYPKIKPGASIVVPLKPERKGMTTAETIGITSSVVTMATLIITLIRMF
ncbi:MAG: periplasmic protein involved in polysaccharide export [Bacteroidetes bacterium]|nr:periplasmic protein involved in polysaccharide export [Bacteroidota bacterium]